jgi:tryptophanyl-tRNA synthetase
MIACRYAVSGGQATVEEHRRLGGNLAKDVPYQWLRFFLDDDAELERIGEEYSSGRMLTGEIKAILVKVLQDIVGRHQRARASVSSDIVSAFMQQRSMDELWG